MPLGTVSGTNDSDVERWLVWLSDRNVQPAITIAAVLTMETMLKEEDRHYLSRYRLTTMDFMSEIYG